MKKLTKLTLLIICIIWILPGCDEQQDVNPTAPDNSLFEKVKVLLEEHPAVSITTIENNEITFSFADLNAKSEVLLSIQDLYIHQGFQGFEGLMDRLESDSPSGRLESCSEGWSYHEFSSGRAYICVSSYGSSCASEGVMCYRVQ